MSFLAAMCRRLDYGRSCGKEVLGRGRAVDKESPGTHDWSESTMNRYFLFIIP